MATAPRSSVNHQLDYPTGDGKPMAETDYHRELMMDRIRTLDALFAADPMVYVSRDLLLFLPYEEGHKRKHISPDVLVTRGIDERRRLHYLPGDEGKGPDLVIDLTPSRRWPSIATS